MRVVWSFSLIFLACGGRTLDDSVFDEGPRGGSFSTGGFGGNPGVGGNPTFGGNPGVGGSFGFGGSVSTGGRVATGGRPGTGGVFGGGGFIGSGGFVTTGGVFGSGGFVTTGGVFGTGGFVTTGGSGSGGAPFVDKSCVRLCDTIQNLCGVPPGQSGQQCATGCSEPLVSSSPACQMATRNLLDCANKALGGAQSSCTGISGLVLLNCADQLLKANACGTTPQEMCSEVGQVSGNQCDRIRTCGATEYHTVCTSTPTSTHCRCMVDGSTRSKMLYSGSFDACKQAWLFPCP
jgi:hypothetical protein